MIPTTLSASTSNASNIGNNTGVSTTAVVTATATASTSANATTSITNASFSTANTKELVVGIASLILEGRAFVDDEFHILSMRQGTPSPPRGPNNIDNDSLHASLHGGGVVVSSTTFAGTAYAGRQSPKPSTSKAATSVHHQHLINITTNPHHAYSASTAPLFIETPTSHHSNSSAASSAESTHQRWTQKLCQLRQASPAASLTASYEQKIAIEVAAQSTSTGGEPELVSLAIHDPNTAAERGAGAGDYEIVRRVMLSRSIMPVGAVTAGSSIGASSSVGGIGGGGAGSASSSPSSGSDNFLHSLQSLATTCLRGNSPSADTSMGYHYATGPTTPTSGYSSMISPKYAAYRAASTPRFQSPFTNLDLQPGSASSSGSGVQSPKLASACHNRSKEFLLLRQNKTGHMGMGMGMGTPTSTVTSSSGSSAIAVNISNRNPTKISKPIATAATATVATTTKTSRATSSSSPSPSLSSSYPQQGPHCDQFLRKMGLAKGEAAEAEDHYCDMSYVNITCSRWRAYCLKMEAIIERCEPICIEVYLGPIGHKVLLEQWIFTFKEKVPPPTMTLPSLCSAIRSQLYFSQISAWCDLIRKSDKSIYDTGRVIFAASAIMGCAGDLATSTTAPTSLSCTPPNSTSTTNITPGSSPNSTGMTDQITNSMLNPRPRLNLFYRIKQYDSTACFNSKPTIHNFPNVNISENCSISVCLKSLPRINGGIPKLGTMMSVPSEHLSNTANSVHGATAASAIGAMNVRSQLNNLSKMSNDETPPILKSKGKTALISPPLSSTSTSISTLPLPSSSNGAGTGAEASATNSAFSYCDKPNLQSSSSTSIGVVGSGSGASGTSGTNFNNTTTSVNRYSSSHSNSNCQQIHGPQTILDSEVMKGTTVPSSVSCASSSSSTTSMQFRPSAKCTFFIDESELSGDGDCDANAEGDADADADGDGDADDMSDNVHEGQWSNGNCGSLSHREKQLLKYRKRMLKRDKKQQQRSSCFSSNSELNGNSTSLLTTHDQHQHQPMEQGEDDGDESEHSSVALVTARQVIKMISTGTQTPMLGCCQKCGNEKSFVCLKCNCKNEEDMQHQDGTDEMDACSMSSGDIISTPRSKGDLLLQAIQRTPKAAKHKQQQMLSTGGGNGSVVLNADKITTSSSVNSRVRNANTNIVPSLHNNNHLDSNSTQNVAVNGVTPSSSNSSLASLNSGCQVCKRQKTQHNFNFDGGNKQQSQSQSQNLAENGNMQVTANEVDTVNQAVVEDDEQDGGKAHGVTITVAFGTTAEKLTPSRMRLSHTPTEIMDEECFVSSTKLTPHFDRCALSSARSARSTITMVSVPTISKAATHVQCPNYTATFSKRSYTPPKPLQLSVDCCEFKTPTTASGSSYNNHIQQLQQKQQKHLNSALPSTFQHKPTPKPNLLQVASVYGESVAKKSVCTDSGGCNHMQDYQPLFTRKVLPKVNLTPIFCNSTGNPNHSGGVSSGVGDGNGPNITTSCVGPVSSPDTSAFSFDTVAINRVKYERAAAAAAAVAAAAAARHMCTANNNNNNNNNNNSKNTATVFDNNAVPVQKSYSAPTLPNSPSLSPRFAKQAAIYKRRSRHLSDRSDRSSLGSDEQYSDEDLDCGGNMLTPGVIYGSGGSGTASPMKQRTRLGSMFNRQPLLGNLEECLLQKRITPKTEVNGFKVLLGASGGFCPTQLTIPAAAYFYELHGETLSTPYVCEIRLPRKGYSVPRTGTIQATLLNPLGTVVRMFVIPYDMRDMPPLHQTFIRQRIMADISNFSPSKNSGTTSSILLSPPSNSSVHKTNNYQDVKPNLTGSDGELQNVSIDHGGGDIGDKNLGHFISAEHMKRLRYSIHLRFQTSRSGRLMLHTDIRLLISRRTDCDTAAAHAKGLLEAPNELITDTVMPSNPKYSVRQDVVSSGAGSSNRI